MNHSLNVADRDVRALVTYKQEGDNNIDIELSHAPSKELDVRCIYNVGSTDLTVKGVYEVDDKTTVEPEVRRAGKSGAIAWNVKAVHRMTSSDKITAKLNSDSPSAPHLMYTRTQDGVDISIGAPLTSNIAADASVTINRCARRAAAAVATLMPSLQHILPVDLDGSLDSPPIPEPHHAVLGGERQRGAPALASGRCRGALSPHPTSTAAPVSCFVLLHTDPV